MVGTFIAIWIMDLTGIPIYFQNLEYVEMSEMTKYIEEGENYVL